MIKNKLIVIVLLLFSIRALSQTVTIYEPGGWLESAFVKWEPLDNSENYNVYYTGGDQTDMKIDNQLIRNYGGYFRADILGLKEGSYTI